MNLNKSAITWPDLKFPPINLYVMPRLTDTFSQFSTLSTNAQAVQAGSTPAEKLSEDNTPINLK